MLEVMSRKPTRSSLAEVKKRAKQAQSSNGQSTSRPTPPERTNAENFYYAKQIQMKTPMVIVLRDGEVVRGVIEWYDKLCLRLKRADGPSLLIYKPAIRYMYKATQEKPAC